MQWRVLGSFGGWTPTCRATSFLINDELALDAGGITQALPLEEQLLIRRIVLSHSHLDHTGSIPFLVENTFGAHPKGLEIFLPPQVMHTVKRHLFNNDSWPDFTRIPMDSPALRLTEVRPRKTFVANGIELTAIPVNHTVPTHGYLVDDGKSVVLFTSDTGPTEEVWKVANSTRRLAAVIVELSFPNRMQAVADVSLHLTPTTLARELAKLTRDVPVLLYHLKPSYLEELRRELMSTQFPHPVEELRQGETYTF